MSKTDTEQLVVQLEARIRDFERNMQKASGTATTNFANMRRQSAAASRAVEADWKRTSASIGQHVGRLNTALTATGILGGRAGGIIGALGPGIFSPGGLAIAGITAATAAVSAFWTANSDGASRAVSDLSEHNRILGDIRNSYETATAKASEFYQQRRDILLLEAQANVLARRQALGDVAGSATVSARAGLAEFIAGVRGETAIAEPLRQMREAAAEFRRTADVTAYMTTLQEIGHASRGAVPEIADLADKMRLGASEALTQAEALEKAEAALKVLQGTASKREISLFGGTGSTKATAERINEYQRMQASIERQVDAMRIEAQTIGMTATEAARFRIEQELLNAARRSGIEIGGPEQASIKATAAAYAEAAGRVNELREEQARLSATNAAFESAFVSTFSQIAQGVKPLDAITNSLMRLADQLIQMAAKDLWNAAFPKSGSGGGITGFFSSIFGSGGGNPWGSVPTAGVHFAEGGMIRGAGTGKSDSILARVSNGEFIVNAESSRRFRGLLEAINRNMLPGYADGGLVPQIPAFNRAPDVIAGKIGGF